MFAIALALTLTLTLFLYPERTKVATSLSDYILKKTPPKCPKLQNWQGIGDYILSPAKAFHSIACTQINSQASALTLSMPQ